MNKAILLTSGIFAYAIYKWIKYFKQQKMLRSFQDKVVWITGASSGLGRCIIFIDHLNSFGNQIIPIRRKINSFSKKRTRVRKY